MFMSLYKGINIMLLSFLKGGGGGCNHAYDTGLACLCPISEPNCSCHFLRRWGHAWVLMISVVIFQRNTNVIGFIMIMGK